jgi:hypothetical protein
MDVSSLRIEGGAEDIGVGRDCVATLIRDSTVSVSLLSRSPGAIERGLGIGALVSVVSLLALLWAISRHPG